MKKNMKSSPLKQNDPINIDKCNKSVIEVCINSMHLRWGMEIRINDQRILARDAAGEVILDDGGNPTYLYVYIENITYSGVSFDITATLRLSENIDALLSPGLEVTFHGDRTLNFHPDRKITGLNIIDGMIFWTDNHSEPKKVNIERGKEGSLSSIYGAGFDGSLMSPQPQTWNGMGVECRDASVIMPDGSGSQTCFSDFDQHTKLIVNGEGTPWQGDYSHIMECEKSTLDCDIWGCTNPAATNWNPQATADDGSCVVPDPEVFGCDNGSLPFPHGFTNTLACNDGPGFWNAGGWGNGVTSADPQYNYNRNDSSLCITTGTCEICDPGGSGTTVPDPTCGGCNDLNAVNYSGNTIDCLNDPNGSDISCCEYCLDIAANNYHLGPNDCSGTFGGNDFSCCIYGDNVGCELTNLTMLIPPTMTEHWPLSNGAFGSQPGPYSVCGYSPPNATLSPPWPGSEVKDFNYIGSAFTYPNNRPIGKYIEKWPQLHNIDMRTVKFPHTSPGPYTGQAYTSGWTPSGHIYPNLQRPIVNVSHNYVWRVEMPSAFVAPYGGHTKSDTPIYTSKKWLASQNLPWVIGPTFGGGAYGGGNFLINFHCVADIIIWANAIPDINGNPITTTFTDDYVTAFGARDVIDSPNHPGSINDSDGSIYINGLSSAQGGNAVGPNWGKCWNYTILETIMEVLYCPISIGGGGWGIGTNGTTIKWVDTTHPITGAVWGTFPGGDDGVTWPFRIQEKITEFCDQDIKSTKVDQVQPVVNPDGWAYWGSTWSYIPPSTSTLISPTQYFTEIDYTNQCCFDRADPNHHAYDVTAPHLIYGCGDRDLGDNPDLDGNDQYGNPCTYPCTDGYLAKNVEPAVVDNPNVPPGTGGFGWIPTGYPGITIYGGYPITPPDRSIVYAISCGPTAATGAPGTGITPGCCDY